MDNVRPESTRHGRHIGRMQTLPHELNRGSLSPAAAPYELTTGDIGKGVLDAVLSMPCG